VNRRTGSRAAVVAAVVALLWASTGAGGASAASVAEVGWWTRNPLSSAPEGGFAVGAAPDGPSAVAALRVDVGGGVETLVLDVAPTSDATSLGSLEVCVAPDTWSATAAGALDEAPATACDGEAVPFGRAGEAWRADVSSLVGGATGAVSLAVVPVAGSGTVPFEVVFEAPTVVATGAAPAPSPGSGSGAPVASPSPTPGPAPSAAPSRPTASPAPIAVGGGARGAAPAVTVPAAPLPDAGAAPTDEVAAEPEASSTIELATSGLLDDVEVSEPRWGEAFVLVLIGAGVGLAVYGTSRFAAARA